MKRVLHPDAWSQRPLWGTNHVVGNVVVERESPNGDVVARSRFHMMELRRDDVRHFAGLYIHHLKKTKDGYRHQAAAGRHDQRAGGVRLRAAGVGVAAAIRRIISSIPADPLRGGDSMTRLHPDSRSPRRLP